MATNSGILIPPKSPASGLATTNDIRPLKPPVEVPNPWLWVYWSAGILLAVALTVLALKFWLRKSRERSMALPVPPHVRAREKLEAALLLISDPRAYCIAVSDAVRTYLEERFQLRAPERTTEEFLRDLQKTDVLNASQKASLGGFLEQCDLVKFARFEPTEAALREMHESALRLVHETQYDSAGTGANSSSDAPPPTAPETPSLRA